MSDLFPIRPTDPGPEPDHPAWTDPTLDVDEARWRWSLRAAEWRAVEMAEAVFGGDVGVRLRVTRPRGAFQGLLHLDVPFRGLEDHRARERVFVASASRDPVLSRTPFVYVLAPVPV